MNRQIFLMNRFRVFLSAKKVIIPWFQLCKCKYVLVIWTQYVYVEDKTNIWRRHLRLWALLKILYDKCKPFSELLWECALQCVLPLYTCCDSVHVFTGCYKPGDPGETGLPCTSIRNHSSGETTFRLCQTKNVHNVCFENICITVYTWLRTKRTWHKVTEEQGDPYWLWRVYSSSNKSMFLLNDGAYTSDCKGCCPIYTD